MTDIEKLRSFAQDVLEGWPPEDLDGADLQDMAVKYGLLEPTEMQQPCSEICSCAAMGADFPTTCYRRTALLKGGQ